MRSRFPNGACRPRRFRREWLQGVTLPGCGVDARAHLAAGGHARLVRRARRRVFRAPRDLAHAGAAARIQAPRRQNSSTRSFISQPLEEARAAARRSRAQAHIKHGSRREPAALTVLTTPIRPRDAALPGLRGAPAGSSSRARPARGSRYPGHYALVRSVVEGPARHRCRLQFQSRARSPGSRASCTRPRTKRCCRRRAEAARVDRFSGGRSRSTRCLPTSATASFNGRRSISLIVPSRGRSTSIAACPSSSRKPRLPLRRRRADVETVGDGREQTAVVYWKSGDETILRGRSKRWCGGADSSRSASVAPRRTRQSSHLRTLRQMLDRSVVAVFLSTFETQGIALAEAWSMDVPTVVWDPQGDAEWQGRHFKSVVGALSDAVDGHRRARRRRARTRDQAGSRLSRRLPAAPVGTREYDRCDLLAGLYG